MPYFQRTKKKTHTHKGSPYKDDDGEEEAEDPLEDFSDVPAAEEEEDGWDEEAEADYLRTRMNQVNSVSAKLGQYLMRGWCMLDTLCPDGNCAVSPPHRLCYIAEEESSIGR